MDSILISIKKMLGITSEYTHFDQDIIMHINSVFMILNQLGVGPENGFTIEDNSSSWFEFVPDALMPEVAAIKSYVYMKVKLLFDPPQSSSMLESYNRLIGEFEWRVNVAADNYDYLGKEESQNGQRSIDTLRS